MRLEQRIGRVDRISQSHDVRALNFLLADSVEYRVQEVLEEKLQTILKEFGVDKTSDVLDSTQAEADFTRLHIRALLNPSQIEAEAEELVARLRVGISRESRNLIMQEATPDFVLGDDAERDASQAQMLEGHAMPFWVEKLVTHAVRAEGGSVEKTLTGWNLRWKDGTEMKDVSFHRDGIGTQRITLEHPRVRPLLTAFPIVAPGMPIPRFRAPGLPTALKGIWSLWELRIVPAFAPNSPSSILTDTMRRVFPVFLNEQGRPLWSSARTIWEWFLREDTMLYPDGPADVGLYEKVASAAESQAHPLFGAKNALSVFISWKAEVGESFQKKAPLFVSRQGARLTRQQAHNIFKKAYQKVGLKGHVTTHSPRKTYAKIVYDNSNNDLVVTQRALRHTDIQSTLYYLDTLADDVTLAMPDFGFGEIDVFRKTSNSKVIEMPKPKDKQDRRKRG